MAEPDELTTELQCSGCGERVTVMVASDNPQVLTEESGRVSIIAGGVTVHQCSAVTSGEFTYLPFLEP